MALIIMLTHSLQEILENVGAILTAFTALTAVAIFVVRFRDADAPKTGALQLALAGDLHPRVSVDALLRAHAHPRRSGYGSLDSS